MVDETKCACLPHADKIAYEIEGIARHARPANIEEDGNYITGMLFVIQESGLADTIDEWGDVSNAAKENDLDKFRKAAFSASTKIHKIKC